MNGTDWERLRDMTDEEAYQNALTDPDNPPAEMMKSPVVTRMRDVPGDTLVEKYGNLRKRNCKRAVTIRYDADVLDYFRAKGKGYQTMMNDALRAFMETELARKTGA